MKEERQQQILKIVENYPVKTQEQLIGLLRNFGFKVAQGTLSRDIKELNIVKAQFEDGVYYYHSSDNNPYTHFRKLFLESNISVKIAGNMIAIQCKNAMAQAVSYAIDKAELSGVVATLARNDMVFVLCENSVRAKMQFRRFLRIKNVKEN